MLYIIMLHYHIKLCTVYLDCMLYMCILISVYTCL